MTGQKRWTSSADLAAKVRRRWDDGTLLSALGRGEPFPALDLPITGPKATELGPLLDDVRAWIAELERGAQGGRRYVIDHAAIGGRDFGRNQIPARARIESYDQSWALLGVARQVGRFQAILDLAGPFRAVQDWMIKNPLKALAADPDWPTLLAAHTWLDEARGSGRYLREISAPGVDTKFVERHRSLLGQLLGVSQTSQGFLAGLGLRAKPELIRLRLDPAVLALPSGLTEATLRVEELAALPAEVESAMIIENEITFLSVPVPDRGMIIWGKGFEVDRAGAMPWLAESEIIYWGDLDTHGFAILNQLRAWLPQTRSVLMDRETLLEHRDRWVREPSPTLAHLDRLQPAEEALYRDLVSDRYGESVRLEQERLDWSWVRPRLPY